MQVSTLVADEVTRITNPVEECLSTLLNAEDEQISNNTLLNEICGLKKTSGRAEILEASDKKYIKGG